MENNAKEKLRVIEIIKENATAIIVIVGLTWGFIQTVILPIKQIQFQMEDILNNHIKTIQDQMIIATQDRDEQGKKIDELVAQLIRLQTTIEKK